MDDEQNLRRNIPFSRSSSDSSAITLDSSPGPSTVWTDEKHRLYLDSLEAAFVSQLHHSMSLRGSLLDNLSRPCPSTAHKLMILRDCSWNNSYSKIDSPMLESTADSCFVQENPCINHFSSASKRSITACRDLQHGCLSSERGCAGENSSFCGFSRSSEQHHSCGSCYHNFVGNALEASDQNFVDEDQEQESNCMASVKRLKMAGSKDLSNDQVVGET